MGGAAMRGQIRHGAAGDGRDDVEVRRVRRDEHRGSRAARVASDTGAHQRQAHQCVSEIVQPVVRRLRRDSASPVRSPKSEVPLNIPSCDSVSSRRRCWPRPSLSFPHGRPRGASTSTASSPTTPSTCSRMASSPSTRSTAASSSSTRWTRISGAPPAGSTSRRATSWISTCTARRLSRRCRATTTARSSDGARSSSTRTASSRGGRPRSTGSSSARSRGRRSTRPTRTRT